MQKKQIFTENEPELSSKLRINKQFADRFEKTKQRQLLDQKRNQKYSDESSSVYSSEDSDGELITDHVSEKFFETLAKIHEHDPSLKKGNVFVDSDFEKNQEENQNNAKTKKKAVTYKDMVRESLLENGQEPDEEEAPMQQQQLAPVQIEQNIKNEFLKAIKTEKVNKDDNVGGGDDDDFLRVKTKGKSQKQKEQKEYNNFLLKNQKIKKYWVDKNLDENEKFLRNFILQKGWIDRGEQDFQNDENHEEKLQQRELLSQDEEFEEKNDKYEEEWNFRFEEPGGNQLISYERKHDGPLHEKQQHKRKEQRERQKQSKLQQKQEKQREIDQLKKAKQQEIYSRIEKLDNVSGGVQIEESILEEMLKEDYDPEVFDTKMKEIFSEGGYFQKQEMNVEELKGYLKRARGDQSQSKIKEGNPEQKLKIDDDDKNKDKDNADQVKTVVPLGIKKKLKPEEIQQLKEDEFRIWYYCDNCQKGLQEYEMKFECLECEDYCLCKKCKELSMHQHKMRKGFVPKGCTPPEDQEIKEILEGVVKCGKCLQKINQTEDHYQEKESQGYVCQKCYGRMKFVEREGMSLVKGKIDQKQIDESNIDKLPELVKDEKINELVEEYYALDFEDIIADGLKTKYKYIKVKPENYGLTDDAIQYCDEKLLNSFVSVKKIAPYREDEGNVYERILKRKRPYIEKNAKQNEKKFRKNLKQLEKIKQQLKEAKKLLKKSKKQKKQKKPKIMNEIMELEYKEKQLQNIIMNGKESLDQINIENAAKQDNPNYEDIKQQQLAKNVSQSRLKSYGIEQ